MTIITAEPTRTLSGGWSLKVRVGSEEFLLPKLLDSREHAESIAATLFGPSATVRLIVNSRGDTRVLRQGTRERRECVMCGRGGVQAFERVGNGQWVCQSRATCQRRQANQAARR